MKLFEDLKYVLEKQNCTTCEFLKVCERDIFFNNEGQALDVCMILQDIEEEMIIK